MIHFTRTYNQSRFFQDILVTKTKAFSSDTDEDITKSVVRHLDRQISGMAATSRQDYEMSTMLQNRFRDHRTNLVIVLVEKIVSHTIPKDVENPDWTVKAAQSPSTAKVSATTIEEDILLLI